MAARLLTCDDRYFKNLRVKFWLSSASKFKTSSPSTNAIPLQCPCCSSKWVAVWEFYLEYHMMKVHPDVDRKQYEYMWLIGDNKRNLLQHVWNTREISSMPKSQENQRKTEEGWSLKSPKLITLGWLEVGSDWSASVKEGTHITYGSIDLTTKATLEPNVLAESALR